MEFHSHIPVRLDTGKPRQTGTHLHNLNIRSMGLLIEVHPGKPGQINKAMTPTVNATRGTRAELADTMKLRTRGAQTDPCTIDRKNRLYPNGDEPIMSGYQNLPLEKNLKKSIDFRIKVCYTKGAIGKQPRQRSQDDARYRERRPGNPNEPLENDQKKILDKRLKMW